MEQQSRRVVEKSKNRQIIVRRQPLLITTTAVLLYKLHVGMWDRGRTKTFARSWLMARVSPGMTFLPYFSAVGLLQRRVLLHCLLSAAVS